MRVGTIKYYCSNLAQDKRREWAYEDKSVWYGELADIYIIIRQLNPDRFEEQQ